MKKWLASLLVVALFCSSLSVTLSESEAVVSEAVDAAVEELNGVSLDDLLQDEILPDEALLDEALLGEAPELPAEAPVPAEELPEEAEDSLPVDAEPADAEPADAVTADAVTADAVTDDAESQAEGDALPVPAEATQADEDDFQLLEALPNGDADESEALPGEDLESAFSNAAGVAIDAEHFPDERLRAYVSGAYDADGDGALSDAERLAVTGFDISKVGRVFSLKGLENFTAIKALSLKGLWLTAVDLSPFEALETLNCEDSRLTAIDLRNNPNLKALHVSGSDLTALDVSQNAQLTDLECARCALASLSLAQSGALESLVCDKNRLTSLSLGQAPLRLLSCAGNSLASIDISGCPKLIQCLQDGEHTSQSGTVSFALSDGSALIFDGNSSIVAGDATLFDPQAELSLEADRISLGVGEKWAVLSSKSGIAASGCAFASSNAKVASVTSAGVVRANKKGRATIRVTAPNGQTATLEVSVVNAPKKVALSSAKLTLGVSERADLVARLPGGTVSQLRWTDSNPGIVRFDGVKELQALAPGRTTLTVRTFNGRTAKCVVTVLAEPQKISFAAPTLTLGAGERQALKPTVEPAGALARLSYRADDSDVATVTAAGVVTALKAGRTTLHAEAYNGIDGALELVVMNAPSSLTLNTGSRYMGVGETFQLVPTIPEGSASRFTYKSSNAKVAMVSADGLITARKTGKAKITVSTYNRKAVAVNIVVKKRPTSIRLSASSVVLGVGQAWAPKVTFSKDAGGGLAWQSDDEAVFTVENGKVTARGIGAATLSVTTYNGRTASCAVTVKAAPTQVSVDSEVITIPVGKRQALGYSVTAEGYSECADACSFTTSNKKAVTVSSSGLLTAVKAGYATVTVTTWNGLSASVSVKAMASPKKIALAPPANQLGVGEQMTIGYRLSPSPSMTTVTWYTSNAKRAIISADGVVTGLSEGAVTITGRTHNGLKASCKLTIVPGTAPVTGVSLNASRITLKQGEPCLLTAQVQPRNARNRSVTWQSSDPSVVTVSDGIVKAVGVGSALITAVANGNSACAAECSVQVIEGSAGLAFLNDTVTLEAGTSQTLQLRIDAADVSMADLAFTSSDTAVAAVDPAGRLTAVGEGTAKVTVTSKKDAGITAECTVVVVKADASGATGDFEYSISGGKCSITGYKGPGGIVVVPSKIEGATVTEIGSGAFAGNAAVTMVVIPEGVEAIREKAFAGSGLTEITLPGSLSLIADNAFDGCLIDAAHAPYGSKAFDYGRARGWFRVAWAPEMKLASYRGEVFKVVNTPLDPIGYESQVRDYICTSPHGTGRYSGYCLGFAYYYVYCLVDNVSRVNLAYARGRYRTSSKLSYATEKYASAGSMMARLYDLLSAGVPQILMVEAITHPGSRHFVTVIGYRSSVTRREDLRPQDLLIIDSFDGKVESMDPAIEQVHTRVLFKQGGRYRIESVKRK